MAEKIRVTQHSGRKGYAKHNDRDFDLALADHIDPGKSNENGYWCIYEGMTFDEAEKRFYQIHFKDAVTESNKRYINGRHPERCKTTETLRHGKFTQPEEVILQIGNKDTKVSEETYRQCIADYLNTMNEWNANHGNPFTVLDVAMHFDETSPHVHIRRVWTYIDDDGHERVGQNKALEDAGVPLPNPNQKRGQYNNRKMVFDSIMRDRWKDICRKNGVPVEEKPIKGSRHMPKEMYIEMREMERLMNQQLARKRALDHEISEKEKKLRKLNKDIEYRQKVLEHSLQEAVASGDHEKAKHLTREIDSLNKDMQKEQSR